MPSPAATARISLRGAAVVRSSGDATGRFVSIEIPSNPSSRALSDLFGQRQRPAVIELARIRHGQERELHDGTSLRRGLVRPALEAGLYARRRRGTPSPRMERPIHSAAHRQVGTFVGKAACQCFVDIDTETRRFARMQIAAFKVIGMWEDGVGFPGWCMHPGYRNSGTTGQSAAPRTMHTGLTNPWRRESPCAHHSARPGAQCRRTWLMPPACTDGCPDVVDQAFIDELLGGPTRN